MPRNIDPGGGPGGTPTLATPLKNVLGGRTATALAKAELQTVSDLLRHYPRRYTERGRLSDLASLRIGEAASAWARVARVESRSLDRRTGQRRPRYLTRVHLTDGHRSLVCSYFNQPWLAKRFEAGDEVLVSGTVSAFRGTLQMSSPEMGTLDARSGDVAGILDALEEFAGGIIPVYPQAAGLGSGLLQRSVKQVLAVLGPIPDPLPPTLLAERRLTDLDSALRQVHRPDSRERLTEAQDRLRYDEALALQLVLARRRALAHRYPAEPCPRIGGGLAAGFDAALPFRLTSGQQAVGEEIAADLAAIHPMNRLLQGEVGSGKTVVALRAMLQVIDAGRQAVLLAPTEVLAAQHARSLTSVLGPLGAGGQLGAPPEAISVTLLTGSTSTAARRAALLDFASGQPGIAVGTHALLSADVLFPNIGLVVIDEQHRFGVQQREMLRAKGADTNPPHVLVMTATPIPRTVAMTVFGDLDVSTLTELPVGRAGVATTVVPASEKPAWLHRAWQRIREEIAAGHQAYVVCPKIGNYPTAAVAGGDAGAAGRPAAAGAAGSAGEDAADEGDFVGGDPGDDDGGAGGPRRPPLAALDVAEHLRTGPLADLRIRVLHGRMPPGDKDSVMRDFAAGRIDVLVSTTVIEVGVDVANATVMVIMDADRFGISQLHQLRGRVGRGAAAGVCLLVTEAVAGSAGRDRLDVVAATADGFELAEADLAMRHEGNVLGATQAGRATALKLLSLQRHRDVIDRARADALRLVGDDADITAFPGLAAMADAIVDAEGQDYLRMG